MEITWTPGKESSRGRPGTREAGALGSSGGRDTSPTASNFNYTTVISSSKSLSKENPHELSK